MVDAASFAASTAAEAEAAEFGKLYPTHGKGLVWGVLADGSKYAVLAEAQLQHDKQKAANMERLRRFHPDSSTHATGSGGGSSAGGDSNRKRERSGGRGEFRSTAAAEAEAAVVVAAAAADAVVEAPATTSDSEVSVTGPSISSRLLMAMSSFVVSARRARPRFSFAMNALMCATIVCRIPRLIQPFSTFVCPVRLLLSRDATRRTTRGRSRWRRCWTRARIDTISSRNL